MKEIRKHLDAAMSDTAIKKDRLGLVCDAPGCPRQLKPTWVPRTAYDPPNAVWGVTPCPWHVPDGCKDISTHYYDKDHNWIDER